jgi:aminoglycoside 2'-N-acetyltransferase I
VGGPQPHGEAVRRRAQRGHAGLTRDHDHRLQVAHTAQVDADALNAGRALLYDVFDDMEESDWEHCLGGMHALVWEGNALIGHAAVIQRRLIHGGRALRTGYVEGVAVRADRRRGGHATAMMDALEQIIRGAYELGALGASEEGVAFYEARAWTRWRGRTYALAPDGVTRTAEEDESIYVLDVSAELDVTGELTCDWRPGEVW